MLKICPNCQTPVGKFFGMNMKAGFHPEKNEEDAIIDRVATLIEQGVL